MAMLDDGIPLIAELRNDVYMEIMGLKRLGMGVAGAVAELAVASAVNNLLVVGGISVFIGHDIIQILREGRGAVIQPVDVFAECVITEAKISVHRAAGFAASLGPVVAGIGGVDAGSAVQDCASTRSAEESTVRIADVPDHRRLTILGVFRSTPDLEAGRLLTDITVESLVGHGGIDVELVGAVGSVHPPLRRVVIAILLAGESGNGDQTHHGDDDQQHCEQPTTAMLGFGVHADTSEIISIWA